ncbi:YcaO-like family protein [Tateyamaria pelophila]|uniref:YcaO-like family protein n=1 Tax=Tateyamaria pelophila TaxID=328415 RepID=UPI001CBBBC9F
MRGKPQVNSGARVYIENITFKTAKSEIHLGNAGSEGLGLTRLLDRLSSNDINVYFADRTRPEFDIPVVRAIAPGLCSDKPRWGWPRLLGPDGNDHEPICPLDSSRPPNELALRI